MPMYAGWMIVEIDTVPLLVLICGMAAIEASMAAKRVLSNKAG